MGVDEGAVVPVVLHFALVTGPGGVRQLVELGPDVYDVVVEEGVGVLNVDKTVLSGSEDHGNVAVDGGGHMVAPAHIKVFQKSVQAARRPEKAHVLVAEFFDMCLYGGDESVDLGVQIFSVVIHVDVAAQVFVESVGAGFENFENGACLLGFRVDGKFVFHVVTLTFNSGHNHALHEVFLREEEDYENRDEYGGGGRHKRYNVHTPHVGEGGETQSQSALFD